MAERSNRPTSWPEARLSNSSAPDLGPGELDLTVHLLDDADMSAAVAVVHVVDDDESFRTAVSRLLKAAGFQTKLYRSAGEFLLDPPAEGPGCVLLDLRMPGPNGLALQESIAKRGDGLPVVFLTGHGDIRQSVRAMRQGAVDFLTKPVQRKDLLAAIEEALKRQSTGMEMPSAGARRLGVTNA